LKPQSSLFFRGSLKEAKKAESEGMFPTKKGAPDTGTEKAAARQERQPADQYQLL
jgi:hypothetical protein